MSTDAIPLDGPAAWEGDELWQLPGVRFELTPAELGEIGTALRHCPTERLDAITPESFLLPSLSARLRQIQTSLEDGAGFVWLRGLPTENWKETDLARVFWGLMSHIGTPVSQTASGERIFRVQDEGLPQDHPQARGPSSRKQLSFHSDRCDVIAFLCIRQAEQGGENDIVSSIAIYNRILRERPDLLSTLMQPFLYQRHNVDPGNQHRYYKQPVFSFCQGHFASSLLRVLIDRAYAADDTPEMTAAQREALDLVEEIAREPRVHVRFRQEAGDVVLLNNFVTLHRRTEFQDSVSPESGRLLLRLWLAVPNSRPLSSCFAASYGATEAGVLRGGMRRHSS